VGEAAGEEDIFPMMAGEAFELLKEDIRVNGQREPIVFWKNMLVDGRNRLKACEQLGIEPDESELMDETDPVAWVVSHNLHRRHLTESQRAMVAAKLATMKHGGDRKSDQESNCTLEKASSTMKVSKDSTKRAKKVIQKGSAKVTQAVEQGELAVSVAAELVDAVPDKAQQEAVIAGGKDEVRRVLKKKAKNVQKATKDTAQKSPSPKPPKREAEPDPKPCARCLDLENKLRDAKSDILKLKKELVKVRNRLHGDDEDQKPAPKQKPKGWSEPIEVVVDAR